ncbi:MAG TPA: leucine-rich repeat protein [Eubacteriales bacterium]|nr:leucine-rich repeat protein [Eubacteriales bacterium]
MKKTIAFFLIFALLLTTLSIAGCSKPIYAVEFDSNGGSRPASQLVDRGELAEEPAVPTRNGFRFDGWFTDEDCEQKFDFTTAINKDVTLYAKWTEIFSVRFFQTDGTLISEQNVPQGEILNEPNDPQKNGYVFIGWYTDENCVQEYDFNIAVNANQSIYAKWVADTSRTWLVNFKQSNETLIDQQIVRGGDRISVPQEPTINGKIFLGWYADNQFQNVFDFETVVTSDLVVYAKFIDITPSGSFQWVSLPNGNVEVKKFIGTETEVAIPSTYDGKTVTSIGSEAFSSSDVVTVIIPDAVTNIAYRAFFQCQLLSDIIIPDAVTTISSYAFYGCSGLMNVSIGNSVNTIGETAFFGCLNLTSVEIPASVTSLGYCAFYKCDNLAYISVNAENTAYKSIDGDLYSKDGTVLYQYAIAKKATSFTIPDDVETVTAFAFGNSPYLNEIIIPDSVTDIVSRAFSNCKAMKNFTVSNDNPIYKSVDGNLYSKDGTKLFNYALGKTSSVFTIPSDVTIIYDNAFSYSTNLTGVNIPDSVTGIRASAFYECVNLKSVTIPDSVTFIGMAVFYGCVNMTDVTIPNNLIYLNNWLFAFCENLTTVVIPESVTGIGDYAFYKCGSLISVNIPYRVGSIGEYAFADCSELTNIRIPTSVLYIYGYAFLNCSNLTINCIATSQPATWNVNWNYDNLPVVWAYKS